MGDEVDLGRRGGRKPGVPNKVTTTFRETITRLLESNEKNYAKWVRQIAEGLPVEYDDKGNMVRPGRPADPAGAARTVAMLAEYAAPKLNRSEIAGDGGGPLTVIIREEQ
jgi:hypothetical protein